MPASSDSPPKSAPPLKALAAEKAGVLHPADNVKTAGERMRKHAARTWPVVDDTKLVGSVDSENPDWKAGGHGHDPANSTVGEIMHQPIFCYEDDSSAHAEEIMNEHGLSHLPVVDREMRVIGIFSKKEISVQASDNADEKKMAPRAAEIARSEGRVASTDDDFSKAVAELHEQPEETDPLPDNS